MLIFQGRMMQTEYLWDLKIFNSSWPDEGYFVADMVNKTSL